MIFNDEIYDHDKKRFSVKDLYIFSIGYEHRSYHLSNKLSSKLTAENSLFFAFDDYSKHLHAKSEVEAIRSKMFSVTEVNYSDFKKVHELVCSRLKALIGQQESISVHIDYSSMPRSWYCNLPVLLQNIMRKNDKVYFWYVEGIYPNSYEEYPSAGIDNFSFFSGMPSLQIDHRRVHILALGYDTIRTQAIISIIDPDVLVTCYAYNPERKEFQDAIRKVNKQLLTNSTICLVLRLNEFSFMVSKLSEAANDLLVLGDVILIPDGPKPLIFAMSLIPDLLRNPGLTCMHVSRNKKHFKPVDVTASGDIYGFSISKAPTEE